MSSNRINATASQQDGVEPRLRARPLVRRSLSLVAGTNHREILPDDASSTQDASLAKEVTPSPRQIVAHHWECTVASVSGDMFTAVLRSLRDPDDSDKDAEIPVDEVTEDDRELLRPGAVFYWTIGYAITASGTRTRQSELKFRRLPAWTAKDLVAVEKDASELFANLGRKDL